MDIMELKGVPLGNIKGIGEKNSSLFAKIRVHNVYELLHLYPRRYQTYETPIKVNALYDGCLCTVKLRICSDYFQKEAKGKIIVTVSGEDETGKVGLTFFNLKFLRQVLKPGVIYCFYGIVRLHGNKLCMQQPQMIKPEDYEAMMATFQPVYPLVKGLSSNGVKKAVKQALKDYGDFLEPYSEAFCEKYQLVSLRTSIEQIHFPISYEDLIEARRRLVFDEFYHFFKALEASKEENNRAKSPYTMIETAYIKRLLEQLPYELTQAQAKAWKEICDDMTGEFVMNRLIQGDVGAGKTILAFLSMLLCVTNGCQCAFMAPTEVLATQHFEGLQKMIKQYNLPMKPVLLTGSLTAKQKREAYALIETGAADTIIGTHAVFQEKVVFDKLALVITDEQHRFGVRQREMLEEKGQEVHVLVMSATPIPRTLASVLYTDLNVSVVDELPKNRLPIKSCVIDQSKRDVAYKFLWEELQKGHQGYVICPMVEASEEGMDLENVVDYAQILRTKLPAQYSIGVLHGQMKPADKNKIMTDFAKGNIDILVSTTVIEVGIDVPNATVILIENAERFGLAQLHQLRGRVGRGDAQSYCVFVQQKKGENERLKVLTKSNDGFFIANEDLRLRGPGDLFGIRQSGIMHFELGDIYQDADILMLAREALDDKIL